MVAERNDHRTAPSAQQALVAAVLEPLLARRRPARILVLQTEGVDELSLSPSHPGQQVIRLATGAGGAHAPVRCRVTALPFERAAFDLVILHHALNDGSEPFLDEVLRVLASGGDLLISGLNSAGLRNRFGNFRRTVPALRLHRVCQFLKTNSFTIEGCLRMGLAGLSRPRPQSAWHGLGLPFADRVVVHGHHRSKLMDFSKERRRQVRPARVTPAALNGLSRETAP